jgi:multidrug efflux pump subunit AcrB
MNTQQHNWIAWFANNPVAANLLMFSLLLGGWLGLHNINKEVFPAFERNTVKVQMSYPGATPIEVEQSIILAIENALTSIYGIEHLKAEAAEGRAEINAELQDDVDAKIALQDIRSAISRISSFPDAAEPAQVSLDHRYFYLISLGVAANLSQADLYQTGQLIRNQLLNMRGVAQVDVRGGLEPQISIEINQQALQAQGLTLSNIANSIRQVARDLPAGHIASDKGHILLRTRGRLEQAKDFAKVPIKTSADGSQLLLEDIATLTDGFADNEQVFEFNGKPGLRLDVYLSDKKQLLSLAETIRNKVDEFNAGLPDTVEISVHRDRSKYYENRQDILLKNGLLGLLLVIIALGLFLNLRLAFWVAVSIPVVFIGSFSFLPHTGVSLNMISMFAFILAIGIVVDDAIIVGENIYRKIEQGVATSQAIAQGAREMATPVIYAVGTNVIGFMPLLFVPGETGQFLRDMPLVASVVFLVSLLEALFILPAHLHLRKHNKFGKLYAPFARTQRFHDAAGKSLNRFRDGAFKRLLERVVNERYLSLIIFAGLLSLMAAWYASGRIDLTWRTEIPGTRVDAEIEMPNDAALPQTLATLRKIEAAGLAAADSLGGHQYIKSWFTNAGWRGQATLGSVNVYLVEDDERPFNQEDFTREWRKQLGPLPEVKSLFFEYLVGPGGNKGLRIDLSHNNPDILEASAQALGDAMQSLPGVVDIDNGIASGKPQIAFQLSAEGRALGLTETSLGQQIRHAFYGAEAQRILRDGKEVKVLVRLPKQQRANESTLLNMQILTPNGQSVLLSQAASLTYGQAYTTIHREDGRRIIKVSASIDKKQANTRRIRSTLENDVMPELQARYPGLQWEFAGGRRDRNKTLNAILDNLVWSCIAIYILLAALFRSYIQGFIVMLTIPFAVAAAIAGHIAMGYNLSSVSIYGMIALGGLVINGALVLTLRYNQLRQELPDVQAIIQASCDRFRPILLTALTTTIGLLPMLFETSISARFLVPMAIALSFGTLAALFVVLLLIPALHIIARDILRRDIKP